MNRSTVEELTWFLLRVVSGFLIWQTGAVILFNWFGGMPPGQPLRLWSQTGIGGILEFAGGTLIIVGLFTRPAAFILSGTMAVAYWQFHFPHGRWPLQNQGMPAVLLCFIFLCVAAKGAGEWSLDAWLRKRRSGTRAAQADAGSA